MRIRHRVTTGASAHDAIPIGQEWDAFRPRVWMMQFHVVHTLSSTGSYLTVHVVVKIFLLNKLDYK